MLRSSTSRSRRLSLLVGVAIGVALGSSAVAAPNVDDGLQGFSGSNGRGFSGSNGRGLDDSSALGFSGSNGRGFSGSNGRGFSGSNGRGFSGSNGRSEQSTGFGGSFGLAAMGTVDAISFDAETAVLTVAGQSFSVSVDEAQSFGLGDYVVAGAAGADAVVYHVGTPYVPGLSAVRVKAPVISVNSAVGQLTVGSLAVDYTAHLAVDPASSPLAGETVELLGTQPVLGGVLLLDASGDGLYITSVAEDAESGVNRQ